MHAPGVEVRPLRQITGESEFNEIFLSGVEVPLDNVIGDVGGDWDVAMTTLLHERGTLGFALVARLEVQVRKLLALAAGPRRDPDPARGDRARVDPLPGTAGDRVPLALGARAHRRPWPRGLHPSGADCSQPAPASFASPPLLLPPGSFTPPDDSGERLIAPRGRSR